MTNNETPFFLLFRLAKQRNLANMHHLSATIFRGFGDFNVAESFSFPFFALFFSR